MLPLCFGEATKVSAYLLDADKTYRVTARLGESTDTGDADGEVSRMRRARTWTAASGWRPCCRRFRGEIDAGAPDVLGAEEGRQAALRAGAQGVRSWSASRGRSRSTSDRRCWSDLPDVELVFRVSLLEGHLYPDPGRGHRSPPRAAARAPHGAAAHRVGSVGAFDGEDMLDLPGRRPPQRGLRGPRERCCRPTGAGRLACEVAEAAADRFYLRQASRWRCRRRTRGWRGSMPPTDRFPRDRRASGGRPVAPGDFFVRESVGRFLNEARLTGQIRGLIFWCFSY